MKVRAAVAHEAGKPLVIETVDLDGPREGEALVEIKATGLCHTDEFTRSGADPFGPHSTNYNRLIGTAARDPVSGTASHRSYLCEIRPVI